MDVSSSTNKADNNAQVDSGNHDNAVQKTDAGKVAPAQETPKPEENRLQTEQYRSTYSPAKPQLVALSAPSTQAPTGDTNPSTFRVGPGGTLVANTPAQPALAKTSAQADLDSAATQQSAPASYKDLSPDELASAEDAIAKSEGNNGAQALTDWLKANPDPQKQDAFVNLLGQYGNGVLGSCVNNADAMSDADKQVLGQALGHAYEDGSLSHDQLNDGVGPFGAGGANGENHGPLGDIIGKSGNPELIKDYALREGEIMKSSPNDYNRAQGVAAALAGLPADDLKDFMAAQPDLMKTVVKNINADPDASSLPYFGDLLKRTVGIQPPSPEALQLFQEAIPQIKDNPNTREGAALFFWANSNEVLHSMQDPNGALSLDGQKKMSEFFARTLFTEPSYPHQAEFRDAITEKMRNMEDSLNTYADTTTGDLPNSVKRDARLFGSLVGTMEGGFQIGVDELKQKNESIDKAVDLIFSADKLIPELDLPGAGKVKDLTVDAVKGWVKSQLHEKTQSAAEAIPFHALFGSQIANPDLATDYDAARSAAFLNRQMGLNS